VGACTWRFYDYPPSGQGDDCANYRLCVVKRGGEGRVERVTDMSTRYWNMKTIDLRRLKSEKSNRIMRLESKHMGYFDQQEIKRLRGHLRWINAVLAAREAQPELPLG